MNDLTELPELVAAIRAAYKVARAHEAESERLRWAHEEMIVTTREAWNEVYRLEALLRVEGPA